MKIPSMMTSLKLGVEVVSGHNLRPKDGANSPSAFVELHFDGQTLRTTVKEKDLNPVWNESFYFNISDPFKLCNLYLEACVYSNIKAIHSRSFIGRVALSGASFDPYSDVAVGSRYPLEKHSIFSRVKRELCLKVYITDDSSTKSSNLPPESFSSSDSHSTQRQDQEEPNLTPNTLLSNDKAELRDTSHHLPDQDPHQHHDSTTMTQQPVKYVADEIKAEPQPVDHLLKETSPLIGGRQIVGGRFKRAGKRASTYDLVEHMHFLFVRVVKALELPVMSISGSVDPYVVVEVGNYKGITKHHEKNQNPEWNEVYAFGKDRIQSSVIEVVVKNHDLILTKKKTKNKNDLIKNDFVGIVRFEVNEVPTRVPTDSPLVPQWYQLEDKKGKKAKGELMLAVWMGMQADEAFPEAWKSDEIGFGLSRTSIRSKVYHAPRLWYVRVNIIEAQDLNPIEKIRFPEVHVRGQIGNQVLKTKTVQAQPMSNIWNEDLLFVAAEPFDDDLILSVDYLVGPNKDEIIGRVIIPLNSVVKRIDDQKINTRWYKLEKPVAIDGDKQEKKFHCRLHLRVCLDGGYHVFDESTRYSSDLRPAAKDLWKRPIGVLELGILQAYSLPPMKLVDGKGTSDAYCVAKYGDKWVRTRTIVDSLSPKYNEQYSWEVYDPATVLTVGVFDNCHLRKMDTNGTKDSKIGKVRIRISTLESGHIYTHTYPLLVLFPSGVKKMGELHLAIRFSCTSLVNRLCLYLSPPLPKMHYIRPISVLQLDKLRQQAVDIVAAQLSRTEAPLRKEVVEYMYDADLNMWSMRRSKATFFRLMSLIWGLIAVSRWLDDVCMWKNPVTTVLIHVLFVMLVCFPKLIFLTVFLYMFLKGIWNYQYRPRCPPHLNTRISFAEAVHPDELDEEFDTFPTSRSADLVRMRYDRLRAVAGRLQTVFTDVANLGEQVQALLSWRDPCATAIFVTFCLVTTLLLYMTPFWVVVVAVGFYLMRHPRFRQRFPSMPINFFRRLPARIDSIL